MKSLQQFITESSIAISTGLAYDKNIESEEVLSNTYITIRKFNERYVEYMFDGVAMYIDPKTDIDGENNVNIPEKKLNPSIAKVIYDILSDLKKSDQTFNPVIYIEARAPRIIRILKSAGFKRLRDEDTIIVFTI